MASKNYYGVLGVPRDESQAGIRAAYQGLAKRLHPDVTRAEATAFQEIEEAYEALSNPARRHAHDRRMFEPEPGVTVPITRRPVPEPISPKPISLFARPEQTRPSFDAFRERYLRNFTGRGVPKAERAESLTLDMVLSPEEALSGCSIPVGVPIFRACQECGGTGRVWAFPCVECAASGLAEGLRALRLRVLPGVRAGSVIEAPLDPFGIRNLYLRVHISVGAAY
jgi:DnaJ-class molecular chaperone